MLHVVQNAAYRRGEEFDPPPQWTLQLLWKVILWRRSTIIWAVIACLGFAIAYLAITPLSYQATAVVATDTKRSPPQPNEYTPDSNVDMAVVETQLEAIRSEKLALSVIDKLTLWKDPEFSGVRTGLRAWISGLLHRFLIKSEPPPPMDEQDRKRQAALAHFRQNLKVERIGRSYVTEVTFRSRSPETAAQVANAVAEGYIDDQLNAKQETLQRSNDWMRTRIAELHTEAGVAKKKLDDFQAQHPLKFGEDGKLESELELQTATQKLAVDRTQQLPTQQNGVNGGNTSANDLAARDKSASTLTQRVAEERNTLDDLRDLQGKADTAKATYQNAVNRFNQALQLQEQSVPATEARILTEATAPTDGSSPKVPLVLILAVVGGGGLGAMGAIGGEYLQGLVRSSQQLATELGVRTLGAVPSLPRNLLSGLRRSQTPLQLIDQAVKGKIRFSPADEAVRESKIAIDQYCREKSCVIGITSARAGEGKTTLAFNLALLAARSGRKTLLIDANLRNRKLSSFLGEQSQGLSELVDQRAEFSQCAKNWDETFTFLGEPSEAIKSHPVEVLGTQTMANHLKAASNEFDYVIVDLPQATKCSEVQALAPLIDGFVFAVEWGKTSIHDLERAITQSDLVAQRLIGVALNKVPDSECAAV